jgi:Holliday junction resolvase-like predicted endonuclease
VSAKAKGTRNEHRSIRQLEAEGYACTRAAASLGAWDVIGVRAQDVVLVQVKTRDWPGLVEMGVREAFPAPANARKVVHRWRHRQGRPDVREIPADTEEA